MNNFFFFCLHGYQKNLDLHSSWTFRNNYLRFYHTIYGDSCSQWFPLRNFLLSRHCIQNILSLCRKSNQINYLSWFTFWMRAMVTDWNVLPAYYPKKKKTMSSVKTPGPFASKIRAESGPPEAQGWWLGRKRALLYPPHPQPHPQLQQSVAQDHRWSDRVPSPGLAQAGDRRSFVNRLDGKPFWGKEKKKEQLQEEEYWRHPSVLKPT